VTVRRPTAWPILLAAGILLAGCTASSAPGGAPSPTPTNEVDVLALAVGDCLDTHGVPRPATTVPVADCQLEHDSEAYAQIVLDESEFPGEDAVRSRAESGCVEAFAEFVGIEYDASTLDYAYYFPTAGSWAEGDRRILCLIVDPGERVTGSLRGATR
jgi:hypothetical protein